MEVIERVDSMESLGEFLKKERETRGIALENIAQESKVSIHYLSLLEGNELNRLPGSTYAKGYLQAYCDCVGLDRDDVFLRYSRHVSPPELKEKGKEKKGLFTTKKIMVGTLLGSVSIAVSIILYLILYFWR